MTFISFISFLLVIIYSASKVSLYSHYILTDTFSDQKPRTQRTGFKTLLEVPTPFK